MTATRLGANDNGTASTIYGTKTPTTMASFTSSGNEANYAKRCLHNEVDGVKEPFMMMMFLSYFNKRSIPPSADASTHGIRVRVPADLDLFSHSLAMVTHLSLSGNGNDRRPEDGEGERGRQFVGLLINLHSKLCNRKSSHGTIRS